MPEKKPKKKPGAPRKRRKLAGQSVGLTEKELATASLPNAVEELQSTVERDGGKVLTAYCEPYGGKWLVMAALPIDQVEPTPYQRNLSDAHVRKRAGVISNTRRISVPYT